MKKSTIRKGAAAVAAAAVFGAGSLMAPPPEANAGIIDDIRDALEIIPGFDVEKIEQIIDGIAPSCVAGEDQPVTSFLPGATADCTAAEPSVIAQVGDAVLGLVAPDLAGVFGMMNSATAVGGSIKVPNPLPVGPEEIVILDAPGNATIAGNGYTMALGVIGNASATADWYLSGAAAIALPGANETATATFGGLAIAAGAAGVPEDLDDVLEVLQGNRYEGTANALPGSVALVFNVGYNGAATALGGYASAVGSAFPIDGLESNDTVCTALYGTASLTNLDGSNVSSCTSVLFLFQKSQQDNGPVNYSIKNPFSLNFTSPLTGLQTIVGIVGDAGILPPEVVGLFDLGFQPEFTQDLIRLVVDDGQIVGIESDLFPSGETETAATTTAPAAKQKSLMAVANEDGAGESTKEDSEHGVVVDQDEVELAPAGSESTGDESNGGETAETAPTNNEPTGGAEQGSEQESNDPEVEEDPAPVVEEETQEVTASAGAGTSDEVPVDEAGAPEAA